MPGLKVTEVPLRDFGKLDAKITLEGDRKYVSLIVDFARCKNVFTDITPNAARLLAAKLIEMADYVDTNDAAEVAKWRTLGVVDPELTGEED